MKLALILLTFLIGFFEARSQITFQKIIGTSHNDIARSIKLCNDGAYLIGGTSYASGIPHIYMVKLSTSGDTIWKRNYGGAFYELLYSCGQTNDGGYFIAGSTNAFGNTGYDFLLAKTNSSGAILWSKKYATLWQEHSYSALQTSDNGFILAGETSGGASQTDILIVKTDSSGIIQWTNTLTGSANEACYDIKQTIDGGYIITGYTSSFGSTIPRFMLVKLNFNGTLEWFKSYNTGGIGIALSVKQTPDLGFIVVGRKDSDIYLMKTDSIGLVLWSKQYNYGYSELGFDVIQTTDGGYAVTGGTENNGPNILIRTDTYGNLLWSKIFTRPYGLYDLRLVNSQLLQTTDSGFIMVTQAYKDSSFTLQDLYIIKTDSMGYSGCNEQVANPTVTPGTPTVNIINPVTSTFPLNWGNYTMNMYTIPTTSLTDCINTSISTEPTTINEIEVFPNPAKNTISFNRNLEQINEIYIISILGKRLIHLTGNLKKENNIDISHINPGLYCICFTSKTGTNCVKFLKE